MYAEGRGVRQDWAEARAWSGKVAMQGDAREQHNLGAVYKYGQGDRQDKSVAKQRFRKACDNGDQDGCSKYRELDEAGF